LERRNAALVATSIAEYFRDQGKHVLLLVDSMTRYARALRDVALSAGEAPARRGYPASVFEALPRLLERSGNTAQGAITAFYTVLLEDDDQADPIGDEVRSILDGHLYLSKDLAARGHFPAIDVLRSASRVMSHVTTDEQRLWAASLRDKLARLAELQLVVDLGEYRSGDNPDTDALFNTKPAIDAFLRQRMDESSPYDRTLAMLSQFR
jgi:type III secretion protein N (ATPase)